ncbi:MAG TPA: DUF6600 domain-containing protein [Ramlibacter sp.]|nr:DUF6600 domain-containing protein [Ramlibacter sp.]
MRARFYFFIVLAGLGLGSGTAFAQADPPGRVARVNYTEGAVSFAPGGDNEFTDAELNHPLVRGDKLWTDKGVRAEIQAGSAIVRMDGRTQLAVLALDDQSTQLSLTQGTVYLRVRTLPEGENFEVDTPNLAWRASYPGDYRIDVDKDRGVTRVTIHSGTGAVYGEKGDALPMGGGQQITFKARALAQVDSKEQPPQDNFDRWAAERNRREDQSVAARYVPREVVGYQLLDASGVWQQDANLGVVWMPQSVPANWAPYRNGRWEWIGPWGWTWIDEQPWAFVTSHYGRWAQVNSKWAWVPGRMGVRPIYSPALVAFVGSGNGPLSIGGKQTVAWFPLAPGEAWQPGYPATPLYISSVNANMTPQPPGKYTYQSKPEALTAIASEDFARGKPAKGSWLRVAANALGNAQIVAPPAMPEQARPPMVARKTQQPSPDIKPAIDNRVATAQQQLEAQKQGQQQAQKDAQKEAQLQARRDADAQRQRDQQLAKAEQARAAADQAKRLEQQKLAEREQQKSAEQQKVAEQHKAAEQQRRELQAKAAEQQRVAEQHRAAEQRLAQRERAEQARRDAVEQSRREALAKRTELAKREQAVARREQARREQVAALMRDRETKRELALLKAREQREQRELQARRAQEARKLALAAAKKDDEARRAAHAQQVELARKAAERDAQVLAAQRIERESAIRRVAEEKERAQREAWQRQQQALAEQFRRDQQLYEEQQRQRTTQRQRPDLRRAPSQSEPEVWQRGIPVLNPGRTS